MSSPGAPLTVESCERDILQVGARGADEQGAIFASSLKRSSVDVKKLRVGRGITGAGTRSSFPLQSSAVGVTL